MSVSHGSDPRQSLSPDARSAAQQNGYPVVASQFARKDRAGLALAAGTAMLLGGITFFAMSASRTQSAPLPAPAPKISSVVSPAPAPLTPPTQPQLVMPAPLPVPANIATPRAPMSLMPNAAHERARAPALVFDNSPAANAAALTSASAASAIPAGKAAPQGLTPEEQFAQRLGGDAETASATRMTSPSSTVAQGTLMMVVLETAIDTDVQGYARAIISRDVKSYDGRQILIPRSSRVIGQYKSGLAIGQTRAYVLWTRLIRPDGVSIALASPATDSSGRNGLSGKVDSHFGKRFGSAILLSVIGAAGQAIGGGGTSVVLAGPQAAASASAQNNINIPPTVRVNQGQPIRIFTARDLDFSSVTP